MKVYMSGKYKAVVMGGSWGGMNAAVEILKYLPADYPLPIVLVLHRLKGVISELPALIRKKTYVQIKEADEKEKMQPGTVYIAPADYHLLIEQDQTFSLDVSEAILFSRPSIDVTFESAAEVFGKKLIGIVLSGASKDGSQGLYTICRAGGQAIVQDPRQAEVTTMPQAAIETVKRAKVLTLDEIAAYLLAV
ncbi:chemotaxis protein CheB [Rhodocytophaga aerolata]|uniref:protein-glutamate methylesterase n=1 Tax=Rhodocytophaga aerolata TaxID=455078 RepID=A0ABT8R503_9BACT|nr:chemotaxis protein CheB [Rhodocytophaga aerolata]MDO1445842.1 chemotaxis protein CheB [Rhodocytophaga aerolata]